MKKKKFIKISKIENQMLDVGIQISIIRSLANILLETFYTGDNLRPHDPQSLAIVINDLISKLRNDFNNIEKTLKI